MPDLCARRDKGSFTTHLTNAEELSISSHLDLMLKPHPPVNSVWNNRDSLCSDSSYRVTNEMKVSGITGFEE